MKPEIAKRILAARDALVKNDIDEAYHQIYLIASPNVDKDADQVWAGLEAIANSEQPKRCFVNVYRDEESDRLFISHMDYSSPEEAIEYSSIELGVYIETVEIIRISK